MPIESATYINSLNPGNPASSDPVADSDNHIRLIKQALKNTFPNVTGPVNVTQHLLNSGIPIGGIIMWSGALDALPAGWALCAGGTHTKTDGSGTIVAPDLRNRFIVGAGSSYAPGNTGGAIAQGGSTDAQGSHAHGGSVANWGGTHDHWVPPHENSNSAVNVLSSATTSNGGYEVSRSNHLHDIAPSGEHAHTLTITTDGAHAHNVTIPDGRPPYYALAFIMRL
jgi:hypothetical protein